MPFPDFPSPLVVIVGPTGVGKTDISIQLASALNGEIVSADSRLFYCGMDIGTAKPTIVERSIIPHHLIDIANPDETISLAIFQHLAQAVISDIHQRKKLPFLVGGTGQYIRAVTQGWQPPVQQPNLPLRSVLETWVKSEGPNALHHALFRLDPEAAENIDPRNVRRTIRALEVIFLTGLRFSAQRQKISSPYTLLVIGLLRPREELYPRIDRRIDAMMQAGFMEEVRSLLDKGYSPELPSMTAIGYKEMINVVRDEMTMDEAIVLMKRRTRNFVRRQANWFKAVDPDIHWFNIDDHICSIIISLVNSDVGI